MTKSAKMSAQNHQNKMSSLDKRKAGKIVLIRILIILFTDIIISSLFDFIKSEATREFFFHMNIHTPLKFISAIILVLAAVYFIYTYVKKIDTSAYYITPAMITAIALYIFATVILFEQFVTTPFLFYTMTVIVSVLFAVYYIYTILLYKK
ncbi:MAG: hypothetical protein E7672_08080 [Ruminococcaceae bacterium]|nr:hypothetical protein [Oscillospiraceae bacterium]